MIWGSAVERRANEVKAAVARDDPDFDTVMLELILATELQCFNITPLTVDDIAHAIAFVN